MSNTTVAPGQPVPIRIFVDSAVRAEAEPWLATGIAHGLTTNPTLLKRAGLRLSDIAEVAQWAGAEGREVCFQLWGETVEEQYAAAMRLREICEHATIKVPVTGQDIVGAWKPLSISRLAMSSTVMPSIARPTIAPEVAIRWSS